MMPFTISKGQRGNIVPIGFIINDYLNYLDEPKFVFSYFYNIFSDPHHGKTNSKMKYHNIALNHNITPLWMLHKKTIVVESQLV
jgi:hypothetical protein